MILTIDDHEVKTKKGKTILEAADEHGIYVPHLCSHPELSSYGGCRLCIVEVEGMRGYPTACTTPVEDGMVVRTDTKTLNEMRKEIIQLILSDHPAGCLVCDEEDECSQYQSTIRKVGATTGCRWCPKDQDCELQKVVKHLEIKEIIFPIYYQGYDVENDDPFFDRDYNLCIYCGRCVRICQEHRKSYVITLNQRGKETTIGPPYKMSHLEADCEFCGACISVCPTGANFEKARKWWGVPEAYHPSFCPFCDLNCEIQFLTRGDKIIGTLPPGDPHLSGGDLCVKGRFCASELVNYPHRVLEPVFRFPEGIGIITWEEAIQKAEEKLKNIDGNKVAFYISPDLSLEEIAAANRFARDVLNTSNISASVLSNNLVELAPLAEASITAKEIENSDCIISLFLNGNYNYAPVTLAVKRAAEKGAPYYQVGWFNDATSRVVEKQIPISPGKEKAFFRKVVSHLEKKTGVSTQIKELIQAIRLSPIPTFILGHQFLDLTEGEEILQSIRRIIELTGSRVFVSLPPGNLFGLLALANPKLNDEVLQLCSEGQIDILYMVGDTPFQKRPPVKFIIHQSSFPPPDDLAADLILPTAVWGEISGSFATSQKDRKKFKAVVSPSGSVLENREIFSRITRAMGKRTVKFSRKEIAGLIPKKMTVNISKTKFKHGKKRKVSAPDTSFPCFLVQEKSPHTFQNITLNKVSEGMQAILPEETIIMNPADAEKLGLADKDVIEVESEVNKQAYPLQVRKIIQLGYVYLITPSGEFTFETNPCPVHIRRSNV